MLHELILAVLAYFAGYLMAEVLDAIRRWRKGVRP